MNDTIIEVMKTLKKAGVEVTQEEARDILLNACSQELALGAFRGIVQKDIIAVCLGVFGIGLTLQAITLIKNKKTKKAKTE